MPAKQIDDLPSEVREQLPQGAQQIFLAAFNSAHHDGLSEEGATRVAWNSVERGYEKGADGKWQLKPQVSNITNKAVQSGGN
jgi:cation transport regulator